MPSLKTIGACAIVSLLLILANEKGMLSAIGGKGGEG